MSLIIHQYKDRKDTNLVLVDLERSGIFDLYSSENILLFNDENDILNYMGYVILDMASESIYGPKGGEEGKKDKLFIFSGLNPSPGKEDGFLTLIGGFIQIGERYASM